jgi:linoleoyl-CoA desaturase
MRELDPPAALPRFARDRGFHAELRRRVHGYFSASGLSPRGGWRLYAKSAAILLWFAGSYALLVFAAQSWWQALPLAVSLVLAAGGIGFSIQHDANQGSYSHHEWLNRVLGGSLDLLGGSSYVWRWKHNVAHHTYANLAGADDDIDLSPYARVCPSQPHRSFHRWQPLYLWVLYGFLVPKWQLFYDFEKLSRGQIAGQRFPRPRGWELFGLVGGKLVFAGWAFALPLYLHPWWVVLLGYAGCSLALGALISTVFQLAHIVEEASFASPLAGTREVERSWAVHQVENTVDFARSSRWLTWYLGGLNFQIEHHLFPKISHVHYPRLAQIVQAVCDEFGVRYAAHEGLRGALASHVRWLRQMAQPG